MNIQTGAGDCTVYFAWLTLPSLAHHSSVTSLKAWCLSLWGCLFRCGQPGHTVACLGLTNEIRRWQWHGVEAKWSPKPQAGAGKGMFWAVLMSHRGPVCSPELLLCSPVCFWGNQLRACSEHVKRWSGWLASCFGENSERGGRVFHWNSWADE